ncbi:hypothetical protein GE21DRAFT_1063267 [Neurospora crassa]|nr:hypothetical protein GE21DRAFT_1063267 [Neurospora crassa]
MMLMSLLPLRMPATSLSNFKYQQAWRCLCQRKLFGAEQICPFVVLCRRLPSLFFPALLGCSSHLFHQSNGIFPSTLVLNLLYLIMKTNFIETTTPRCSLHAEKLAFK